MIVYFIRIRLKNSDSKNYLYNVLEERILGQDKRLAELTVNYEILNDKLNSIVLSRKPEYHSQTEKTNNNQRITSSVSAKINNNSVKRILIALLDQDMTAIQVMKMLGCTREHAARLMKQLADKGLIERVNNKKPFIYRIKDKGKDFVSNN